MLAIKRDRGGREVGDRGCRRQSFAPADNRPASPLEIRHSTAATRCKAQPQPPYPTVGDSVAPTIVPAGAGWLGRGATQGRIVQAPSPVLGLVAGEGERQLRHAREAPAREDCASSRSRCSLGGDRQTSPGHYAGSRSSCLPTWCDGPGRTTRPVATRHLLIDVAVA